MWITARGVDQNSEMIPTVFGPQLRVSARDQFKFRGSNVIAIKNLAFDVQPSKMKLVRGFYLVAARQC